MPPRSAATPIGGGMVQMEDIPEDGDVAISALEFDGLDDDDGRTMQGRLAGSYNNNNYYYYL